MLFLYVVLNIPVIICISLNNSLSNINKYVSDEKARLSQRFIKHQSKPTHVDKEYRLYHSYYLETAHLNEKHFLNCFVDGARPIDINWYHNGVHIDSKPSCERRIVYTMSKMQLYFQYVKESDAGVWQCKANNSLDIFPTLINYTLKVERPLRQPGQCCPPSWLRIDKFNISQSVPLKKRIALNCSAYGEPPPSYKWFLFLSSGSVLKLGRNNRDAALNYSVHFYMHTEFDVLVMKNELNSGIYVCIAYNWHGSITRYWNITTPNLTVTLPQLEMFTEKLGEVNSYQGKNNLDICADYVIIMAILGIIVVVLLIVFLSFCHYGGDVSLTSSPNKTTLSSLLFSLYFWRHHQRREPELFVPSNERSAENEGSSCCHHSSNNNDTYMMSSHCSTYSTCALHCHQINRHLSTDKIAPVGFSSTTDKFAPKDNNVGVRTMTDLTTTPIPLSPDLNILYPHDKDSICLQDPYYLVCSCTRSLDSWNFPKDRLILNEVLGEGAFGRVYKAEAIGLTSLEPSTTVAVKTLKEMASEKEKTEFITEINVMHQIGYHPNILRVLAIAMNEDAYLLVVEYALHGNLRDYLKSIRCKKQCCFYKFYSETDNEIEQDYLEPRYKNCILSSELIDVTLCEGLRETTLLHWCLQICRGMDFLASKNFIHRDLAARNILVMRGVRLKISDFGLSRHINHNEHYYRKNTQGLIPMKWLSPESLKEQIYTIKSDIWSFGIVMWEIFSYGLTPYADIPMESFQSHLSRGYRLPTPSNISNEIYTVMYGCWNETPNLRPPFCQLCLELDQLIYRLSYVLDVKQGIAAVERQQKPTICADEEMMSSHPLKLTRSLPNQNYSPPRNDNNKINNVAVDNFVTSRQKRKNANMTRAISVNTDYYHGGKVIQVPTMTPQVSPVIKSSGISSSSEQPPPNTGNDKTDRRKSSITLSEKEFTIHRQPTRKPPVNNSGGSMMLQHQQQQYKFSPNDVIQSPAVVLTPSEGDMKGENHHYLLNQELEEGARNDSGCSGSLPPYNSMMELTESMDSIFINPGNSVEDGAAAVFFPHEHFIDEINMNKGAFEAYTNESALHVPISCDVTTSYSSSVLPTFRDVDLIQNGFIINNNNNNNKSKQSQKLSKPGMMMFPPSDLNNNVSSKRRKTRHSSLSTSPKKKFSVHPRSFISRNITSGNDGVGAMRAYDVIEEQQGRLLEHDGKLIDGSPVDVYCSNDAATDNQLSMLTNGNRFPVNTGVGDFQQKSVPTTETAV